MAALGKSKTCQQDQYCAVRDRASEISWLGFAAKCIFERLNFATPTEKIRPVPDKATTKRKEERCHDAGGTTGI